jgi:hypothetical protein
MRSCASSGLKELYIFFDEISNIQRKFRNLLKSTPVPFFPNVAPEMKNETIKSGCVFSIDLTTTLFPPTID